MNVATYMVKRYSAQPCWELVADVLCTERKAPAVEYRTITRSVREMANAFRVELHKSQHGFLQVEVPRDFTVVLLGRSVQIGITHCGIWFDGKVLHAQPNLTLHEELSAIKSRWPVVEFWDRPDGAA